MSQLLVCFQEFQARLRRVHAKLLSLLEYNFGLLDELYATAVLTDDQVNFINVPPATYRAHNKRLVQVLSVQCDEVDERELLAALRRTNQSHVAAIIESNNGMNDSCHVDA